MTRSALVVGDSYLSSGDMARILEPELSEVLRLRFRDVDPADRPPLPGLSEYQGSPDTIASWLSDDDEILILHAAPVTAALLDARPGVRVVACARGGAVNVDAEAARDRGVVVLNTPAKNADSVADLAMTYLHLLFRKAEQAHLWLLDRVAAGETHLDSTFSGGLWIAREPRGHVLGLVGFGAIGSRVARQAVAAGMSVLAYDPYAKGEPPEGVRFAPLDEVLGASDAVSIHARESAENRRMANASFFAAMKPGSFFVNTARESLVDEDALLAALTSGHLAGAALDVCEPEGHWPRLAGMPQVFLTPHLGGATVQTQERGLLMLAEDLRRHLRGEAPLHRVA